MERLTIKSVERMVAAERRFQGKRPLSRRRLRQQAIRLHDKMPTILRKKK